MIEAFFITHAFVSDYLSTQAFSVNNLIPKPKKTSPLILFNMASIEGFSRNFLLNRAANNAKHEHHIKPVVAKVSPNIKNDSMP